MENISVGFDLGGTNMRAAVFRGLDADSGPSSSAIEPVAIRREETGANRSPADVVDRVALMISRILLKS